ncbi:resolvase-like protein [Nitratireductor indicus C115]|uniref:Resolvase-like protein n=1 Tax=Nitratireductor indicus C115 TaxID=1231190 RepID=K2NYQ3_9HYPH|nr:recombinase family protein [Nitratireductor indicus]EKF40206.1 resolvase-like protein [Nitratireductor indicus C115]SFQ63018.1 Site-specific DNA recombinase [Nitratireductor indicus]
MTPYNSTPQICFIYCRVSSIKQAKSGDGLRSQETRCRDYARSKGYEVVRVFTDDVSGSSSKRDGMTAFLAALSANDGDPIPVIIDDVSRLARDVIAHKQLRISIAMEGGILESPNMQFGDDADSEFQEMIRALVAQHQRQKNAEQTTHRMRARVQNGYWVFRAPTGYKYVRQQGSGKVIVRDEPTASIVQCALEGYASDEFASQADVMRFLQDEPLYPKDRTGKVRNQRISDMLRNWIYAGYVEAPGWGIARRKGNHEAIVSTETMQRIEDKLNGINRAPYRKELSGDFPLRGYVICDDCGNPLTACWSKGSHGRYPYYLCPKRGCESYGKSIRRDKIEGEFERMLTSMQPSETLFRVATMMFEDAWNAQRGQADMQKKALKAELADIERKISRLLERIIEATVPSVVATYEKSIGALEQEKVIVEERIQNSGRPRSNYDDALRTALGFLANPCNLWRSGRLEDRHAVLKLAFADRLRYTRKDGFRTANLTLPFKVLGAFRCGENEMARPKGFEPLTPRFVVQIYPFAIVSACPPNFAWDKIIY